MVEQRQNSIVRDSQMNYIMRIGQLKVGHIFIATLSTYFIWAWFDECRLTVSNDPVA